jgi:hypothetical protein
MYRQMPPSPVHPQQPPSPQHHHHQQQVSSPQQLSPQHQRQQQQQQQVPRSVNEAAALAAFVSASQGPQPGDDDRNASLQHTLSPSPSHNKRGMPRNNSLRKYGALTAYDLNLTLFYYRCVCLVWVMLEISTLGLDLDEESFVDDEASQSFSSSIDSPMNIQFGMKCSMYSLALIHF